MEPIGVLHPGAMGAAIGRELVAAGRAVYWVTAGRGANTRRRAEAAGLRPVATLDELASSCPVILSVCPPAASSSVAAAVAATGFDGRFVDANAIAPSRARAIAGTLPTVDGGIVGPPPGGPGRTVLYLSGADAGTIAALFDGTAVEARVLGGEVGQASALKLAFSAYNKITFALAAQSYALADAHGVRTELEALAGAKLPDTPLAEPASLSGVGARAWRWAPEMREIAAAATEIGLPPGVAEGAAALFARWAAFRDDPDVPLERLLDELR
ncbi:NAD(P)-dependent oxidoreductase [Cryptosporangium japonicum]|uniref:NAD(P)-dependent oxidoreductase n=1 Tax=Cryptosporangium japonicum TaxID=80872 RepID=A0ABN0U4Q9_9ACTN